MKPPPAGEKKLMLAAALALLLLVTGLSGAARPAEMIWAPPALQQLIDEALQNNHAIRSRAAQVKALKSRIDAADALPDPKVGFAVQNLPTDSFAFDREPMTQKQIFLEQTVPWLSKLDLRTEAAARAAREKKAELAADRLELARKVADAWYELGYVARSQQINNELIDLIRRVRREARDGYEIGEGLQQNIFQAGVELASLEDEAIRLENRRRTVEDRLHELTNRDRYQPIDPPADLPEPGFSFSSQKLTEKALGGSPELTGLQAAANRAQTETQLAKKDYYPDFDIRLTYGQRDEDRTGRDLPDFFSAAVAMDIPMWHQSKQSNEVAAAADDRRSAEDRLQDLKSRLPYKINALVAEIKDTRRRYRLYQDKLIAQADQWARSALEAYEVGRVEFDTMINARIRVLEYRREASRLLFTIYQKHAALEALIGGKAGTDQKKNLHESKGQSHDDQ